MKQSARLLTTVMLLLGSSRLARAEDEPCPERQPWVAIDSRASSPFTQAVRSELRAGLAPSGIALCDVGSSAHAEPLARLSIAVLDASHARYRLEVTDSLTKKLVARELTLEQLPPDGRALGLAVAAEELLRASWAELALRGVHSAQTAAPPEVRAVVERAAPPAEPPQFKAFGARFGFEHFTGGQTHYGADVFASVPLTRPMTLIIAVGVRRALAHESTHGRIEATGLAAETALAFALVQRTSLDFSVFGAARALRLTFEPEADPGSRAQTETGFALGGRAGLALALGKAGLLRSYSALGAGLVLQEFSAADSAQVVTGASGLELFGSAGLAWELP